MTIAKIDAVEASVADDRALQIRAGEMAVDEIGATDLLAGQIRAGKIAALEYRSSEIGGAQIGCGPEVGAHQSGLAEIDAVEITFGELNIDQCRTRQIGGHQSRGLKGGPVEMRVRQLCPA